MNYNLKVSVFSSLFYGILFGAILTIVCSLLMNGKVIWSDFPLGFVVSVVISTVLGILIPAGKLGAIVALKFCKPNTLAFKAVMYSILMIIILLYMCPAMTFFNGYVLGGVPLDVLIPVAYDLFLPLFLICLPIVLLVGDPIMKFAQRCEGKQKENNKF